MTPYTSYTTYYVHNRQAFYVLPTLSLTKGSILLYYTPIVSSNRDCTKLYIATNDFAVQSNNGLAYWFDNFFSSHKISSIRLHAYIYLWITQQIIIYNISVCSFQVMFCNFGSTSIHYSFEVNYGSSMILWSCNKCKCIRWCIIWHNIILVFKTQWLGICYQNIRSYIWLTNTFQVGKKYFFNILGYILICLLYDFMFCKNIHKKSYLLNKKHS